jgi:type II secretion system protein N
MHIFRKRALWFILYGLLVTVVFLYILFPSGIVKNLLESAVGSPDLTFKAESLRPSLPLGIKLKNIVVSAAGPGDVFFQGENLDLQPDLWSLLQKRSYVSLSGKAYAGSFDGRIGFVSGDRNYFPAEGAFNFQNIDLDKNSFIKRELGRDFTGKAKGRLLYNNASANYQQIAGTLKLTVVKGSYLLAEPF